MARKYADLVEVGRKLAPGEPWFLIRGQDLLSPQAISAYAALLRTVGEDEQAQHVEAAAVDFLRWQSQNRDRVKLPD